jgi:hypothetical protein
MNAQAQAPVNVICLKYGKLYPAHYVNRLYAGVCRHLNRPFSFHCCTENPKDLHQDIHIIPFPKNPGLKSHWPHVLAKLMLTKTGFGNLSGATLFLDLDVVITESLDAFFDYQPGRFCIIHNWVNWRKNLLGKRPHVGNSSVFRFEAGEPSDYIYQTFLREMSRAEDRSQFNTEQAFLTYAAKDVVWWPHEWVRSFKWHCRPIFPLNLLRIPRLPTACRVLVFHGNPDPEEAINGFHGTKWHHRVQPSQWVAKLWAE